MKKKRVVLILCVIVLISGLGYLALQISKRSDKKSDAGVSLACPNNINCISIEYKGETTSFELYENKWLLKDDPDFPLKASSCNEIKKSLCSLTAMRILSAGNTDEFGFDKPVCVISATDPNGNKHQYTIGKCNESYDVYYMNTNNSIYTISSSAAEFFFIDRYDLILADKAPEIDPDDIISLSVRSASGKWYYDLQKTAEANDSYTASGTLVDINDPDRIYCLDHTAVQEMLKNFSLLYFYKCVSYDAETIEKRALYGLDTPTAHVCAQYKTSEGEAVSYELDFGSQTDNFIYLIMENSSMVFKAYTSEVLSFISPNFASIISEK